jgi:putative heme iron utilization protein
MKKENITQSARNLLRTKEKAILSTHSVSREGYPFGSVTTYISDYSGNPIIYISHLAQHTRNIKTDPKISMIITEENGKDINAGARLTLLGKATLIDKSEEKDISEKFWARFPESRMYQNSHDFKFYRIKLEHIRYIGGFGQIHWVPLNEFLLDYPQWKEDEQHAIDHMNEDHIDAMQLMLKHFKGVCSDQIKLTHLYPDGCIIKLDEQENHYLPYQSLAINSKDIRIQLVKLTQEARKINMNEL